MREELLRIIGRVYDAAGDPAAWEPCLASICDLFHGTGAGLLHHDHRSHGGGFHAIARYDPDVPRLYAEHYHRVDPWAIAVSVRGVSAGEILPGQVLVPHDEMVRTEFHAAFGPTGHTRALMAFLDASPARSAVLSINRSDAGEAFDRHEVALAAVLLPHLRRALQIHRRVAAASEAREAMAEAIDRLGTGVLLVDASLRPVVVNRAAGGLLQERDGLSIEGGELRAATPAVTRTLRAALASAVSVTAGRSIAPGGAAFRLPRPSGREAYQVVVTPLARANDWTGAAGVAAAAVFVADPERATRPPEAVLRQVYGFTPAEARVAASLAAGAGVDAIADRHGLTRETTRWYVKTILAKAGVSTQAAFVRLVLNGPGAWAGPR